MTSPTDKKLEARIQSLSDREFENFVAELWESQGFKTQVSSKGADAGIDIVATRDGLYREKHLIQAKAYSEQNSITGPDVQQYAGLKPEHPDVDLIAVVTSGRFTDPAQTRAKKTNVKAVDINDLCRSVQTHELEHLLKDAGAASRIRETEKKWRLLEQLYEFYSEHEFTTEKIKIAFEIQRAVPEPYGHHYQISHSAHGVANLTDPMADDLQDALCNIRQVDSSEGTMGIHPDEADRTFVLKSNASASEHVMVVKEVLDSVYYTKFHNIVNAYIELPGSQRLTWKDIPS